MKYMRRNGRDIVESEVVWGILWSGDGCFMYYPCLMLWTG